ncbi:MAG: DUF1292 domain-containing protein [Erysipelotrichaceae bacterium]|mgnify:FL=1|nr:DUF1292 domain-containing protein [Erysipelotrichaceae bacterium]
MLDSNSLYIKDENGEDKKMTILFTFDSDDFKKQYVVFEDPENPGEVYATQYTDQGELIPIPEENKEEWEMVEEVINTFLTDEEDVDD